MNTLSPSAPAPHVAPFLAIVPTIDPAPFLAARAPVALSVASFDLPDLIKRHAWSQDLRSEIQRRTFAAVRHVFLRSATDDEDFPSLLEDAADLARAWVEAVARIIPREADGVRIPFPCTAGHMRGALGSWLSAYHREPEVDTFAALSDRIHGIACALWADDADADGEAVE